MAVAEGQVCAGVSPEEPHPQRVVHPPRFPEESPHLELRVGVAAADAKTRQITVLGLVAHVAAYAIRTTAPEEPLGLAAELIYALGYALWTGAVIVVFLDLVPKAKVRQIRRAIASYDAIIDKQSGDDHRDG